MDNIKQWNIIHTAYKKYLQDCKQQNINANSFGNWLKNNYVAPQLKAIQVQAVVMQNFADVEKELNDYAEEHNGKIMDNADARDHLESKLNYLSKHFYLVRK